MTDEAQFQLDDLDDPDEHRRVRRPSPAVSPMHSPAFGPTVVNRRRSLGHARSRSMQEGAPSNGSPPFASSPSTAHAHLMDYKHHKPSSLGASPSLPRPMGLPTPPSAQAIEPQEGAPWAHPPRSVSPPLFPFSMAPVSPTLRAMSPLDEGPGSPARRNRSDIPEMSVLPQPALSSPTHSRKRSLGPSLSVESHSPSSSTSPPRVNGFHPSSAVAAAPLASTSAAHASLLGTTSQGVVALRRRASVDGGNQGGTRTRHRTSTSPSDRPRSVSPKRTTSQSSSGSQSSDSDSPNSVSTSSRPSKSPRVSPSSLLRHSFSDEVISQATTQYITKRSPSYEDVMRGDDSPPSPLALLPQRGKSAHLAMPPPSGWDMSDDVDESGSDSNSAGGSDRDDMEEDNEIEADDPDWQSQKRLRTKSGEPLRRLHHRRTSSSSSDDELTSAMASPDSQSGQDEDEDESEPWGPLVEAGMPRTMPPPPPWSQQRTDEMQAAVADGSNEQLTMLEHIFIFSKSEWREHRVIVSRSLADWMEDIDICETLEFVYPLLTALASDDDEVKLGLASNLDRIMWYFYSRCPIVEIAPPEPETVSMEVDAGARSEPSKLPRLSATAFVPLLGLLLMEPQAAVTAAARMAVVRFLCRLNDQPVPLSVDNAEDSEQAAEISAAASMAKSPTHPHEGYVFSNEAKGFLESQILSDVVLGLAHLDQEQERDEDDSERTATPMEGIRVNGDSRPEEAPLPINEDDWPDDDDSFEPSQHRAVQKLRRTSAEASPDWGEPLSRMTGSTHYDGDDADTPRDAEEVTSGKIAALELSGAIASNPQCLSANTLESQVLAETVRLSSDSNVGVRSASATALGHLAGALPEVTVISQVLPPFEALAADPDVEVRRSTCFALSYFVNSLTPDVRRARIVWAVKRFANDKHRAVQIALVQLSGQLFHALHLVSSSIPSELVDFYLGRDLPAATSPLPPMPADEKPFTPLATALSSAPELALPSPMMEQSDFLVRMSKQSPDPERAAIIAYNLPAVALSLGADRWQELRDLHLDLSRDNDANVRKSIAASLHEVARIIGPSVAARDLAPIFEQLVTDSSEAVRSATLVNATDLVAALPASAGREALDSYTRAMFPSTLQGEAEMDQSEAKAAAAAKWRDREEAAQALHILAPQYARDEPSDSPFYDVLTRLIRDPAASVRLAAIDAIPDIYLSLSSQTESRQGLVTFLTRALARDHASRARCSFVSVVRAVAARPQTPAELVRVDFLPMLTALADDGIIDVRITVAREAALLTRTLFKEDKPASLVEAIAKLAKDPSPTVRSYVEALISAPPSVASSLPSRGGMRPASRSSKSPSAELDDEMLDMVDDELSASAIRDLDDSLSTSPPTRSHLPPPYSAAGDDEGFVRISP